jgi:hypothetical protein
MQRKYRIFKSPLNEKVMTPRFLFSLILTAALCNPLFSQNTDSLESLLDTIQGEGKVKTLNELFRGNLHADPVKAVGYAREALMLATDISHAGYRYQR